MKTAIKLPDLGSEPGQPIHLSHWFASVGESVYEGDRLVEVLVDGATFDVSAPATGSLAARAAIPDDIVQTGQVLGWIDRE